MGESTGHDDQPTLDGPISTTLEGVRGDVV